MAKKNKKFKTEVNKLLDLVIHSLYTKKEIYLRELISNASDAIDRARYESLTEDSLLKEGEEYKIKITPDKDERTITITDNGIGMNLEEIETHIGTIASSGTKKFMESLKEKQGADNHEFIGQFGVGFYSAFMVADEVTVVTKRRGDDQQAYEWKSEGVGSYSVDEVEKDEAGTEITLHLREGMDEHLEEWEIRKTVKQYSDYISYPICMDVTKKEYPEAKEGEEKEPIETIEEETLNSMKAIWRKNKSEVSKEEYIEFYKHVSHDYAEPMETIHFSAEGVTEFQALVYIPSKAPLDMVTSPDQHHGIHLYVKNVFISDDCKELLPDYLRFIRGVVDSSDLPLNVSREMLQDDAVIRRIRKSLVSKILSTLKSTKERTPDKYYTFWEEFGRTLKEGLHFDSESREKLQELTLFNSTKSEDGKPVFLREYIDRMPDEQKEIYYITGDNLESLKDSPHLEVLKSKDYEVLLYADPIDEWVAQTLTEYDGKKFKAIDRGDLDLDSEDLKKEKEEEIKEAGAEYKDLLEFTQKALEKDVKEVKLSTRLTDSACCLVADEFGMNANMERIMKAMGQEHQPTKRTLELNHKHPLLPKMKAMFEADKEDSVLNDYCELLLDQALMTEGSPVRNPAKFARLVSDLMAT
jgi:molecular chaperone HtpG